MEIVRGRDQGGDPAGPAFGHHLRAVPIPVGQHQQPQARHVSRREIHGVLRVAGNREFAVLALLRSAEVLHLERFCQVFLKREEDILPGDLFERRPCCVEVPVLVLEVRPRRQSAGRNIGNPPSF
jgi:hypothetical protein